MESIPEQLDTRPEDYQSGSYVTVTLRKEKRQLGFRIKKNPVNIIGTIIAVYLQFIIEFFIENCGLFVTSIDRDPALCDGRILVGDELVKVFRYTNTHKLFTVCDHTDKWQEPDWTITRECTSATKRRTRRMHVCHQEANGTPSGKEWYQWN